MKEKEFKKIWCMICIHMDKNNEPKPAASGLFDDLHLAKKLVLINDGDLCEGGFYPYVVLESYALNCTMGSIINNQQFWFKWNRKEECYKPIDRPDFAKNTFGWL